MQSLMREECIAYIEKNHDKMQLKDKSWFSKNDLENISDILSDSNAEKIYCNIGDFLSLHDKPFDGIHYREECYDYLISVGIDEDLSEKITTDIRKGKWKVTKCKYDVNLPDDFDSWADGVRYLASRRAIFENFKCKNE